jgi:hypothetical protein
MFRPFRLKSTFQFRSEARDRQTDQERINSIDSAIEIALRSAQAERTALGVRVEEARVQASFLTGTDHYEHDSREPAKKKRSSRTAKAVCAAAKRAWSNWTGTSRG